MRTRAATPHANLDRRLPKSDGVLDVIAAVSALIVALGLLAAPALAAEGDALEELLVEKGFITEEELEEARAAAGEAEEAESEDFVGVFEAEEEEPRVDVSVGTKGLVVTSPDGDFSLGIGGRLQLDAAGFSGNITPEGDGIQLRRGRLKAWGTVWRDWDYKFEIDFGGSGDETFPTDAWIRYSGWKPFTITIGHQKVPFSQQSMTSSNWQVFQERALQDSLIDTSEEGRRRLGGVLQSYGQNGVHWNLAAGLFGEGLTDPGVVDEDWAAAGRAVIAPFAEYGKVLAVGGAVYYREFESATTLRYRSRPESDLASNRLVDTGVFGPGPMNGVSRLFAARETMSYNAEASFVLGPVHAQGEYTRSNVKRWAASTLVFDGWYVQGGFFITGESRVYDMKSGKYKRPKPSGKIGAWEIAARYSTIDLQSQEITGGRESNVTAGLNWWVNQNIMFRFNYVRAMVNPTTTQISPVLGGGRFQNLNAFMGRAQIVF